MADTPKTTGAVAGPSFFQIYKKGQGYYTRVGTAAGAGLLAAAGAHFVRESLSFDAGWVPGMWLKNIIPLIVLIAIGLIIYWVVGVHRRSCDFMIATEGEMKKVNWTTKRQLKASTAVVIIATIMMALMLFLVDTGFRWFFMQIDVLHVVESTS